MSLNYYVIPFKCLFRLLQLRPGLALLRDLFHVFLNNVKKTGVKITVRFIIYKPGIKVSFGIMLLACF